MCGLSPALTPTILCCGPVCYPGFHFCISLRVVGLPTLGAQYPVFNTAPTAKLMEEGKVHAVEHLINPLAMQHPEHTTATAAAAVLPAVSTPPPFQVCLMTQKYTFCLESQGISSRKCQQVFKNP